MPKIIPELREKILSCARKHIVEDENHDFSTRLLASECGVAAGTIFNYFSTKEELLASVILEDWTACLKEMTEEAERAKSTEEGLLMIEGKLRAFSRPFLAVWQGYSRPVPIRKYHARLVKQLSEPIEIVLQKTQKSCSETELQVISEMLLSCSQREEGLIARLIPVMEKILQ
ncbi:MAG: helix-turn-helix transcriptional regulator [Lachnospiraceae bacterium]|nr:helix-turn-helix transcriptional regulator [Lachnospiraceae bacterium]